jgi:membrane-bound lytic murein transglycosylase D
VTGRLLSTLLIVCVVLLGVTACAHSGGTAPVGTAIPAASPAKPAAGSPSRGSGTQKDGASGDGTAAPAERHPSENPTERETTPDRGRRETLPQSVQEVRQVMEDAYQDGLEAYQAGRTDEAREHFDRAVDIVLSSGIDLNDYPAFKAAFDEMVGNIADLDAELFRQEPPAAGGENASPLDTLKDITTYLSPEEAEKEREKIQKVVGTISYDIPITLNPRVLGFIEAFQTRIRGEFEAGLKRSGSFLPLIKSIFRDEGLPEDLAYMAHQESAFKITAYSRARAKGMWQFMSFTGKKYGLRIDPWVDERSDFEKSTRAAARYLKDLYERYGDWYLAMAAYNAGEGKIDRAVAHARTKDFWAICKTRYIRAETKSYVPAILASILIDKSPGDYGFDVDLDSPLAWETVTIDKPTDLQVLAEGSGAPLDAIRFLNGELRGLVTPPNVGSYTARVPVGSKDKLSAHLSTIPDDKRVSWTVHEVKNGETFTTVARRYKVPVRALVEANPRYAGKKLRHGWLLNVPLVAGAPVLQEATTDEPTYEAGERIVHRVRSGDNLQQIAGRYHTTVANLKRWNHLDNSVIRAGQRVVAYYGEKGSGPVLNGDAPVTVAGDRIEYKVQQGDTLNSIARKFSAQVGDLQRWNNLTESSVIHPGERIWVGEPPAAARGTAQIGTAQSGAAQAQPAGTGTTAPAPATTPAPASSSASTATISHRVKKGETLNRIARLYDVTVGQVASWNGLSETAMLYPGQVLRIHRQ